MKDKLKAAAMWVLRSVTFGLALMLDGCGVAVHFNGKLCRSLAATCQDWAQAGYRFYGLPPADTRCVTHTRHVHWPQGQRISLVVTVLGDVEQDLEGLLLRQSREIEDLLLAGEALPLDTDGNGQSARRESFRFETPVAAEFAHQEALAS